MAFTMKQLALVVSALGITSFVFGVIAENKKPSAGTPITGRNEVICNYPSDPSIALGYLSFLFLAASTVVGYFALFYPYKGRFVPHSIFFQSRTFLTFFNITLLTAGLAAALTLWPTIQEHVHINKRVHPVTTTDCPTAKTGLFGGGAFVALDSTLFWLMLLMLVSNVREDFLTDSLAVPTTPPIDIY